METIQNNQPLEPAEEKTVTVKQSQLNALVEQNRELKQDMGDALSVFNSVMDIVKVAGLEGFKGKELNSIEKMMLIGKLTKNLGKIIETAQDTFSEKSQASQTCKRLLSKYSNQLTNG
ncbi:hypothetical protein QQ054_01015 [Oscillatoria amoena NRMC-F 0135]|nr:hypothetical protein [Oscillatoria amoena NRMC-F 0135]